MPADTPSVIFQGIGAYVPARIVTNEELSQTVDTSDEWIRTRSGIRERRIAGPGQATSDLAVEAARAALDDAGLTAQDIDLIIVATMSPDMSFPSTACLVQSKLGANCVAAFDISAACSGFLYALETGTRMMQAGSYRHALVIGAEKMSSLMDWDDRATCVLFGDAAGAVVLGKSDQPGVGVIDSILRANGERPSLLYMPSGGSLSPASAETVANHEHFLKMNGKEIFKVAVRDMGKVALDLLEKTGVSPSEVACFIPHQANIRIIEAMVARMGVPMDKFLVNIDQFGNTSAASIPLALEQARRTGKVKPGDYVLMAAFGAGLTWAASLVKLT
ncbi:ketoacyl-ACP synthase III [Ruficoccus amylovorans]|uniref:Beta-ketoacyl-[acyl-carrier-protein] synthase III n=1 Tax=Ruficoccus amylovorans TaxID=1804625 RepID=A0A842H9K9_9BACT|nr:beta-ketoacyl-ACP synthase III [Ruficoccus amylovorans]MBC2593102.1 ketoacyl-ACP synthase III [Ruficoccus amylovorans]